MPIIRVIAIEKHPKIRTIVRIYALIALNPMRRSRPLGADVALVQLIKKSVSTRSTPDSQRRAGRALANLS